MELFSAVAKLTLDAKEYERALSDAENKGEGVHDVEATLDLNTDAFDQAIDEAENTDVADPASPDLDLNTNPFEDAVEEAEGTDVADPASPDLDLNTDPYKEALDQAEADTETWSGTIGDIFSDLKGVIAAAGITATLTGIVSSLSDAVDLARSTGDNIDKSSRAMSITTDAYQEWSHVLEINGASITDLNRGLMNMRKLMGGGEPTKEFTQAMIQLGLATEDAEGNITSQFSSTEDMLKAAMKALADFDTSTEQKLAERDYLAQAIFGRGGTKLNAMFDGTSEDIDFLIDQAHELGLVMTEEEVANAAAYNDAVTNMQRSFEAFKTSLVTEFLPVLTDITNSVTNIISMFNLRGGAKKLTLSDVFEDIDTKAALATRQAEDAVVTAQKLVEDLATLGDYWTLDEQGQMTWDSLAARALELFPQLSEYIDTDGKKIQGNTKDIEANIEAWGRLEKQRIMSSALEDKQKAVANQWKEVYEKEAEIAVATANAQPYANKMIEYLNEELANNAEFAKIVNDAFGTTTFDDSNIAKFWSWNRSDEGAGTRQMWDYDRYQKFAEEANKYGEIMQEAFNTKGEVEDLRADAENAEEELAKYAEFISEQIKTTNELVNDSTSNSSKEAKDNVDALNEAIKMLPNNKYINIEVVRGAGRFAMPFAKGEWTVPYDNLPALLHRGERVLTASQARQMDSGGNNIDLSGMYDIVKSAIVDGMAGASVNSFLSEKDVTDNINRNTGRQLKARRFRG